MIGRGARGKPWLLKQIHQSLLGQKSDFELSAFEKVHLVLEHYESMLSFYGKELGIRVAKKHLDWYLKNFDVPKDYRREVLTSSSIFSTRSLISNLSNYEMM